MRHPDPHYSIHAGKIWILGFGDWAVSDASLFIGQIPVLWLPFFYYPSEELVFHPVIGSRTREGRYLQTTTWVIGEKAKSASTASIFSFGDENAAGDRSVKGAFYRNLNLTKDANTGAGTQEKPVSGTVDAATKTRGFLKVLADIYSNLGAYAGLEGSFPDQTGKSTTDFSIGIGFSRSLFIQPMVYIRHMRLLQSGNRCGIPRISGAFQVPFRFGIDFKSTFAIPIGKSTLNASVALPAFSDPYFEQDFRGRSDDMEWLKIFSAATTDSSQSRQTVQSQPDCKPLGRTESSGIFKSRPVSIFHSETRDLRCLEFKNGCQSTRIGWRRPATVHRRSIEGIFYPDTLRFFDLSTALRGTFIQYPKVKSSTPAGTSPAVDLRVPWQADAAKTTTTTIRVPETDGSPATLTAIASSADMKSAGAATIPDAKTPTQTDAGILKTAPDFRLPVLVTTKAPESKSLFSVKPFTASLTWNLNPSGFFEDRSVRIHGRNRPMSITSFPTVCSPIAQPADLIPD